MNDDTTFWHNRRVLITGGAGLIGSHIADILAHRGAAEILVIDNFTRGARENLQDAAAAGNLTLIEGDIRDRALVTRAIDGVDIVFHQAAIRITQCAEEPRLAMDVMATGAYNVLEAAAAAGVSKVVAASSASVYGLAEDFPTTEKHHALHNRTIYGALKTFNEGLLRSFHEMYRLNFVALRYFNVYGPRMDATGRHTEVLIRWMERIAAGLPPVIFGNGEQTLDMVYAGDIARANLLAAERPVTDEILNVASGRETTLRELALALLDVMDAPPHIEFGPERTVNPVPRRCGDTSRARSLLGFETEVSLQQGLRSLVAWWRNQYREYGAKPCLTA